MAELPHCLEEKVLSTWSFLPAALQTFCPNIWYVSTPKKTLNKPQTCSLWLEILLTMLHLFLIVILGFLHEFFYSSSATRGAPCSFYLLGDCIYDHQTTLNGDWLVEHLIGSICLDRILWCNCLQRLETIKFSAINDFSWSDFGVHRNVIKLANWLQVINVINYKN